MGAIAISMFIGISWLVDARRRGRRERGAFGPGPDRDRRCSATASLGFYVVQVFTAAILILAANTAYQDFPRLASILARDRYLPSQFVNRGDRFVFSNGVLVLGLLSAMMIYIFDAT